MWLDTLIELKRASGKTLKQITDESGVPLGTVNKIFAGQSEDPKIGTLQAIVHCLGGSLDDLFPVTKQKSAPSYSEEALDVAAKYDAASTTIKNVVKAVLAVEEYTAPVTTEIIPFTDIPKRKIPWFKAAGGRGDPEPDVAWDYYETENQQADFAVHIVGDSMEPYLPDGTDALGTRRRPRDGEVGVFRLDGDFLVKQVCTDSQGNVYLFSLNRLRDDADQTIMRNSGRDLWCFGTVMCGRHPLP